MWFAQALAEQADELWALHAHNSMVAAVQEQQCKDKAGDNKKKEKSDRQGPSLVARLESGLCHDQLSGKHFLVDMGGHLLSVSSSVFGPSFWSSSHRSCWPAYCYLGGDGDSPSV